MESPVTSVYKNIPSNTVSSNKFLSNFYQTGTTQYTTSYSQYPVLYVLLKQTGILGYCTFRYNSVKSTYHHWLL